MVVTDARPGVSHTASDGRARMPGLLEGNSMTEIVVCPEPGCDAAAEIVSRWVWPSTDGPVEHVKTSCVRGHHRTLRTASLVSPPATERVAQPRPSAR